MTSREHWHLLSETDDLLDHHGLLLSPVRSLPDAEQQLAASGLRGPGFDDLLSQIRTALTDRAIDTARTRVHGACIESLLPEQRRPAEHDHHTDHH